MPDKLLTYKDLRPIRIFACLVQNIGKGNGQSDTGISG